MGARLLSSRLPLQVNEKFRELGIDRGTKSAVSANLESITCYIDASINLPPARNGIPALGIHKTGGVAAGVAANSDIVEDFRVRILWR